MPFQNASRVRSPANDDLVLWRYVPFRRFEDLVRTGTLHFHSLSDLQDKFEGTFPLDPVDGDPVWMPSATDRVNGPDEIDQITRPIAAEWSRWSFHKYERDNSYISCWTNDECECTAMWEIYLRDEPGLAIRTTFGRLKNSFAPEPAKIWIGRVKYRDFSVPPAWDARIPHPALIKHEPYRWEREIRAIRYVPDREGPGSLSHWQPGIPIRVNLETLIDRIVMPPESSDGFKLQIQETLKAKRLDAESISNSVLDVSPRYY